MEKSLSLKILEHLLVCGPRLIVGMLFIPYGQSLGRTLREADRLATLCQHDFSSYSPETVSVTLQRMKKQNLVALNGSKKKAVWRITQAGRKHFKKVESENGTGLPPEDGKTRLIVFDIPEDRRGDRNWLRGELLSYDYSPLQKSVFMGTRPLPIKLLKELESRELLSYIHIVGLEGRE